MAADFNEVVKTAGVYAASSAGSDTYAITVTPTPGTYAAGDVYHFKADVGNTGAATLNVNSLGAKNIYINRGGVLGALATGDIIAGQFVDVIYDGVQFQIVSPSATGVIYKNGVITRVLSAVDGAVNTAHGLGFVPRKVRITVIARTSASVDPAISTGAWDGINTATVYHGYTGASSASGTDTTNIVFIAPAKDAGDNHAVATLTVDATNLTLTWTKTGTPTVTAHIMWEAEV